MSDSSVTSSTEDLEQQELLGKRQRDDDGEDDDSDHDPKRARTNDSDEDLDLSLGGDDDSEEEKNEEEEGDGGEEEEDLSSGTTAETPNPSKAPKGQHVAHIQANPERTWKSILGCPSHIRNNWTQGPINLSVEDPYFCDMKGYGKPSAERMKAVFPALQFVHSHYGRSFDQKTKLPKGYGVVTLAPMVVKYGVLSGDGNPPFGKLDSDPEREFYVDVSPEIAEGNYAEAGEIVDPDGNVIDTWSKETGLPKWMANVQKNAYQSYNMMVELCITKLMEMRHTKGYREDVKQAQRQAVLADLDALLVIPDQDPKVRAFDPILKKVVSTRQKTKKNDEAKKEEAKSDAEGDAEDDMALEDARDPRQGDNGAEKDEANSAAERDDVEDVMTLEDARDPGQDDNEGKKDGEGGGEEDEEEINVKCTAALDIPKLLERLDITAGPAFGPFVSRHPDHKDLSPQEFTLLCGKRMEEAWLEGATVPFYRKKSTKADGAGGEGDGESGTGGAADAAGEPTYDIPVGDNMSFGGFGGFGGFGNDTNTSDPLEASAAEKGLKRDAQGFMRDAEGTVYREEWDSVSCSMVWAAAPANEVSQGGRNPHPHWFVKDENGNYGLGLHTIGKGKRKALFGTVINRKKQLEAKMGKNKKRSPEEAKKFKKELEKAKAKIDADIRTALPGQVPFYQLFDEHATELPPELEDADPAVQARYLHVMSGVETILAANKIFVPTRWVDTFGQPITKVGGRSLLYADMCGGVAPRGSIVSLTIKMHRMQAPEGRYGVTINLEPYTHVHVAAMVDPAMLDKRDEDGKFPERKLEAIKRGVHRLAITCPKQYYTAGDMPTHGDMRFKKTEDYEAEEGESARKSTWNRRR